jgi:hypothetical protein
VLAGELKVFEEHLLADPPRPPSWSTKYARLHKTQLSYFDNEAAIGSVAPTGLLSLKDVSSVKLLQEEMFGETEVFELVIASTPRYFQVRFLAPRFELGVLQLACVCAGLQFCRLGSTCDTTSSKSRPRAGGERKESPCPV